MTAAAVHTVFRCVASWNRGSRRGCPTLGVAVSLLADRLRTTGRIYITLFGLAPTPLEVMQNPGWSTQRHPRATALICTVRFIASVATGTIGRRRFLRGVAVPACLNSVSTGSIRRTAAPVRTVFSCVASRKREEPLSPGTKPPGPRRAPTLSGRINLFPLPRSSRGGSYFL